MMGENDNSEPGLSLEQLRNDHLALEMALLRVRNRHEAAGDAHKFTFGDLLDEARQEAQAEYLSLARGDDAITRFGPKSPSK